MSENLIIMDNTFSRKELEEAFWLGFKCIGLLDADASNRFNDFTSNILAKRQLKYNKIMNTFSEHQLKNWWDKLLSPMQRENFVTEYFPDRKVNELSWEDIKYISDEEDAKLGF